MMKSFLSGMEEDKKASRAVWPGKCPTGCLPSIPHCGDCGHSHAEGESIPAPESGAHEFLSGARFYHHGGYRAMGDDK